MDEIEAPHATLKCCKHRLSPSFYIYIYNMDSDISVARVANCSVANIAVLHTRSMRSK
jgi:hypothetical protein